MLFAQDARKQDANDQGMQFPAALSEGTRKTFVEGGAGALELWGQAPAAAGVTHQSAPAQQNDLQAQSTLSQQEADAPDSGSTLAQGRGWAELLTWAGMASDGSQPMIFPLAPPCEP